MKSTWFTIDNRRVRVRFISRMCPINDYGVLEGHSESDEKRISLWDSGEFSSNDGELLFKRKALQAFQDGEAAEYAQWRIDNAKLFVGYEHLLERSAK